MILAPQGRGGGFCLRVSWLCEGRRELAPRLFVLAGNPTCERTESNGIGLQGRQSRSSGTLSGGMGA